MKLKYKKIILLTTMSTMGIGLLTLSISNDRTQVKESLGTKTTAEAGLLADVSNSEVSILGAEPRGSINLPVTVAPTQIPTPVVLPVYEIEEDSYPEINQLFVDFYTSKTKHDVDAMKLLLSNQNNAASLENLQKKTQFIEEYKNIKTYTKKSFLEGTYIVYVYHEIKFTGIETPAPGLSKFYIVTGDDGKLKILSEEMDAETKDYYDTRDEDEDVVEIIEMTNKKSKKAMEKDEDLNTFWKSIDELAKSKQVNEQAEGDSAE